MPRPLGNVPVPAISITPVDTTAVSGVATLESLLTVAALDASTSEVEEAVVDRPLGVVGATWPLRPEPLFLLPEEATVKLCVESAWLADDEMLWLCEIKWLSFSNASLCRDAE